MENKMWTLALLASIKGPVTLTGKVVDDNIIAEFTQNPDDPTWDYNVHQWSYNSNE